MADVEEDFTEAQLRLDLVAILNEWITSRADGSGFETKAHAARVGTVYALTAHTYKLGFAVNTLIDADFKVESIPLIRAAYEATITAAWIQQVDDALPAYLNRNHNQQKALRDIVQKAGWASRQTVIAADTLTPFLVSKESKAGASWTEQMCADFFAGDGMYSVYRGLSWLTHPTAAVSDLYIILDQDDRPTLRNTATIDGEFIVAWLHILCSTLIWSARALNLIDAQRARTGDRQRLRDWATRLHIPEFLAVTPDARFRGQKAERRRARMEDNRQDAGASTQGRAAVEEVSSGQVLRCAARSSCVRWILRPSRSPRGWRRR